MVYTKKASSLSNLIPQDLLNQIPVMEIKTTPIDAWARVIKRCIDLILSIFLGIFAAFIPSTKDAAAIIMIPKIANNQDVQDVVKELWKIAETDNLPTIGDLAGYKNDFLNLFGFGFENVDYKKDANEMKMITSI